MFESGPSGDCTGSDRVARVLRGARVLRVLWGARVLRVLRGRRRRPATGHRLPVFPDM